MLNESIIFVCRCLQSGNLFSMSPITTSQHNPHLPELPSQTYDYLRSLAKDYPDVVKLYVGGTTFEGRDILGVKLSYKEGNPKIFVESGEVLNTLHAQVRREKFILD
jgi:hypothetical protein